MALVKHIRTRHRHLRSKIYWIDWTHPLSRGLIACYVPGIMGGVDLTGLGPILGPLGSGFSTASTEGIGYKSNAANSGLTNTIGNAARWNQFTTPSAISLYYRGVSLGTPSASSQYFGVSWDTAGTSPFVIFTLGTDGTPTQFQLNWNSSGAFTHVQFGTIPGAGGLISLGATLLNGGNVVAYNNGLNVSSNAITGAPTNTATSTLDFNCQGSAPTRNVTAVGFVGYIWNRQLTDAEMLWLHLDSYSFLVPVEMPFPKTAAAAAFNPAWVVPYNQIVSGGRAT